MLELRQRTTTQHHEPPVSRRGLGAVTLAVIVMVAATMAYVGLNARRAPQPMRVAATIAVRADENVVFALGSVWALTMETDVEDVNEGIARIDPATNSVVLTFRPTETRNIHGGGRDLAFGPTGLWVSNPMGTSPPSGFDGDPAPDIVTVYEDWQPRRADLIHEETTGALLRFDPATGVQRAGMLFVDHFPGAIAVTPEGVWTTTERGIALLDPETLTVQDIVGRGTLLAAGRGAVWAASAGTVIQIDPVRREVAAAVTVTETPEDTIRDLTVDGTDVWVTTDSSVVRIRDSRVVARIPVEDPWGIAAADGHVVVKGFRTGWLHHIDPRANRVDDAVRIDGDPLFTEVAIGAGSAWVSGEQLTRVDLPS
jgi:hypothetical protein